MGNLVRLKQLDQVELSGYVKQVSDSNYYPASNPSGFIDSVVGDPDFDQLSLDLSTLSGDLNSSISSTGNTLAANLNSTGSALSTKIDNLSGYVEVSNSKISTVSGNVNYAQYLATGLDYSSNVLLSGDIINTSGYALGISGALNTKINTASGNLSSRISSLENTFTISGASFLDLVSNNQTVLGQKSFDAKTNFKLINIVPVNGDYSNPGGQNNYLYTQFLNDTLFFMSGQGNITGDIFVTKIRYPNNEECIISSNIYTGSY
jgi:hypothetical protein